MRKEELRKRFFDTLSSAGISSKDSLESVRIDFSKIEGLSSLSSGERKQFFSEYQTQALKREKEELRIAKQRAREDFRILLEHWGEDGDLDPDISFRRIASACHALPLWTLLDVEELEDIFQDYIVSYESSQRHLIKERHYQRKRELYRILEDRWGTSQLVPSWADSHVFMSQNTTAGLDDLDRFEVFEDFIMEKNEKMKEEKRKQERREGRKKREAFITLLESLKDRIIPSDGDAMRWDDLQPLIKDHHAYFDLIGSRNSSQPYDLFTELRSKWKHERESRKRSLSEGSAVDSEAKRPR